ncbi:MAG: hypothetical protein K5829_13010 [Treponema sp.]|nr:hypothetical protein [Treponema sp.]
MKILNFNIKGILIFLLFSFITAKLFSKVPENKFNSFPSIEPLFTAEEELGYSPDDSLSPDEIIKLSLLFSECPLNSREAKLVLDKFENIKKEASSKKYMEMAEEERGRAVLKLIYRDTLKTYKEEQTKVNIAFINGKYNCLSSALIYMAAAKAVGLDVRGVKTPLHAFCSVYVKDSSSGGKRRIDVETTNPYGFNPGSKEAVDNESLIKKYYLVPKKNYSNRQEVSDKVFTGLIAQNLCAGYILSGEYTKAIPLGAAEYNFIIDEKSEAQKEVRKNFDILPGNFVNQKPKNAEEYADLVNWFTSFIDRWKMTKSLQNTMNIIASNLIVYCCQEENYNLAIESWNKNKKYLDNEGLAKNEVLLVDVKILTATDGLAPEEQIKVTNDILRSNEFKSEASISRAKEYLENFWIMKLNELMSEKNFEEGYEAAKKAQNLFPKNAGIRQMGKNFYNNCIAVIHNKFAKMANEKKYNGAKKIIEEGLKKYPNDSTLKKDLSTINKILKK